MVTSRGTNLLVLLHCSDPKFTTQYLSLDKTEATKTRTVTETIEVKQDFFTSHCLIRLEKNKLQLKEDGKITGQLLHEDPRTDSLQSS